MVYFTIEELNPHKYELTPEQVTNLNILIERLSKFRAVYGKPMKVNSGVRDLALQLKVNPKSPKSKHLIGAAADIDDPEGELATFCKANLELLEQCCLWCEDFEYTKGWVHFQIFPPASRKRVFRPF